MPAIGGLALSEPVVAMVSPVETAEDGSLIVNVARSALTWLSVPVEVCTVPAVQPEQDNWPLLSPTVTVNNVPLPVVLTLIPESAVVDPFVTVIDPGAVTDKAAPPAELLVYVDADGFVHACALL